VELAFRLILTEIYYRSQSAHAARRDRSRQEQAHMLMILTSCMLAKFQSAVGGQSCRELRIGHLRASSGVAFQREECRLLL